MLCDLELIKDIHVLDGKEIVIWGAGNNGKMAYEKLKYMFKNPINHGDKVLFCDSDSKKWSKNICGNGYVISPCELCKLVKKKKIVILIASDYVNEIIQKIEQIELMRMTAVCTWFGFKTAVHFHFRDKIFSEKFKENYLFEIYSNNAYWKYRYLYGFMEKKREFFNVMAYEQSVHVIQPGKVGSSTIFSSLHKSRIPCTQMHHLSFLKEDGDEHISKKDVHYCQRGFAELKERGMRIIVIVREPVSRDISAFWFSLEQLIFAKIADLDIILFFKKFLKEAYSLFEMCIRDRSRTTSRSTEKTSSSRRRSIVSNRRWSIFSTLKTRCTTRWSSRRKRRRKSSSTPRRKPS